jgi:acyl-CoA synthetase (AMP-forming)/AMP-acid ligase II
MGLENFLDDRITEDDSFLYTIPAILAMRARHTPDETAYIFLVDGEDQEEKITYRELDLAARAIAEKLTAMGMKGERALMLFPTGMHFIKALFGCFYAGVIAVAAYPPRRNRSLERIRLLVEDSGTSLILTIDDIRKAFERSFSDVEELGKLQWLAINNLTGGGQDATTGQPSVLPAAPESIALLQYTSGSTGNPKGVMVTHRNIMRNLEYIRQSFGLSRKSVSVTWLPSFHDMGLIDGVMEPVYTGFPGIIINPVNFLQKPSRWLKAITKYKGTHCGAPNFAFDLCVDEITDADKEGLDLSSLHTLYCGAEPIYKETFDRFIEAYRPFGFSPNALYPCYGMAETTLIITGPKAFTGYQYITLSDKEFAQNRIVTAEKPGKDTKYLVGVGFPWIDTKVRIVDPNTFRPCEEKEIGEIWVNGSIVTAGYWNNDAETEKTYAAEIEGEPGVKYLRTGDLGFFCNGELFISGRLKDIIILFGQNIYPQDIEHIAEASHPAIRANASAAFSIEKDRKEKLIIIAEVERTAMHNLDVDDVCDAVRLRVAEEKELSVYGVQLIRTASIPKTSSGKIQRKACKQAFLEKKLEVIGESFTGQTSVADQGHALPDGLVNLQAWVMSWLHLNLNIPLEQVDFSKPLSACGLDMIQAHRLKQSITDRFDITIYSCEFLEEIPASELCLRALKRKAGK